MAQNTHVCCLPISACDFLLAFCQLAQLEWKAVETSTASDVTVLMTNVEELLQTCIELEGQEADSNTVPPVLAKQPWWNDLKTSIASSVAAVGSFKKATELAKKVTIT
jgi:hypothetical protein